MPQMSRLAAEQDIRTEPRHQRERGTDSGFLLGCARDGKARPFRLVEQIERRDRLVRNDLAVERQHDIHPVMPGRGPRGFVKLVGLMFDGNGEAERRSLPIKEPVAKIEGAQLTDAPVYHNAGIWGQENLGPRNGCESERSILGPIWHSMCVRSWRQQLKGGKTEWQK
jgi:hypothetical protein